MPLPSDPGTPASRPRILIISDAWEPQVNGVVRSYQHLTREWRAMGHEVRVIGPAEFTTLPMPGYSEIRLALWPGRRLARLISQFNPDIIHIAVEGPLGWAARRYCLRHGLAFSTSFHTNFPAYIALRAPRVFRVALERLALVALCRFHNGASPVFVATPSIEALLRNWGFHMPLARLSRGVDTTLFFPAPETHEPDRTDHPTLLYVGRIAPEKSLETFLSLDARALGPHRKVIVGDGPALGALQRAFPDAEFCGKLEGKALADAYRRADVFVFPSRTDTFGIVLIEALASGLPIAAHDAPGPRDIVTKPSLGSLDDDLACAIRRALNAPGGRAARAAHMRATYDWNSVAAAFLRGNSSSKVCMQPEVSTFAAHTTPAAGSPAHNQG
ncbi:glycosyltransferase family 4 protein [Roseinatronobacter sp. NSM]|uniref:glycosyltransferase family 4 protein n=1 Tax=Roseinatronobacter sp. NSM TaxID=3457785 RepID=UPI004035500E